MSKKKKSLENSTNALHSSQKIETIENDSKVKNQKTEFCLSTLKPAEVKGPLPGAFLAASCNDMRYSLFLGFFSTAFKK